MHTRAWLKKNRPPQCHAQCQERNLAIAQVLRCKVFAFGTFRVKGAAVLGGPSAVSGGQQGSSWRLGPASAARKAPYAVQHRRVQPAPPAANMRGACGVACCIALIGAPLGRGQMLDGSPPPRGAWNGAPPGTELLQWGCTV